MDLKTLGRNIRRARQMKFLTQENAADDLGCSLNTYTKIERGETNVPFTRLVAIANYLEVNVSELTRDVTDVDLKIIAGDIALIKEDIAAIKNAMDMKSSDGSEG